MAGIIIIIINGMIIVTITIIITTVVMTMINIYWSFNNVYKTVQSCPRSEACEPGPSVNDIHI